MAGRGYKLPQAQQTLLDLAFNLFILLYRLTPLAEPGCKKALQNWSGYGYFRSLLGTLEIARGVPSPARVPCEGTRCAGAPPCPCLCPLPVSPALTARAPAPVLKNPHFFLLLGTSLKKGSQRPPTELPTATNRQLPPTANRQPPTAANRQPLFNTVSVVLCLAHVLTMKQSVSLVRFCWRYEPTPFFPSGHPCPCRCPCHWLCPCLIAASASALTSAPGHAPTLTAPPGGVDPARWVLAVALVQEEGKSAQAHGRDLLPTTSTQAAAAAGRSGGGGLRGLTTVGPRIEVTGRRCSGPAPCFLHL